MRLILAEGRVRSEKKNAKKKRNIAGLKPQQPSDRDNFETACHEISPTLEPQLARFGSR